MHITPAGSTPAPGPLATPAPRPQAAPETPTPRDAVSLGAAPPAAVAPPTPEAPPTHGAPAVSPSPAAVPASMLDAASPVAPASPGAFVLRGAPLWSSLAAGGWLREQFADPAPERALTPPEKAGVIATFGALRDEGVTFYRDHGTDGGIDLQPVGDDELATLLDGGAKPAKWKMSYVVGPGGDRFGFVHFLPRVAELAFFLGVSDRPDGLSSPQAAVAIRHLMGEGWTLRRPLDDGTASPPIEPEKAYLVIAGGREEQNLRNGYSLLLEPPSGPTLHVHTAAEMALLSPTCPPGTASALLAEHRSGPDVQAALDVASLLSPEASLAEARALLGAVSRHLRPRVDDGSLSARSLHPILRTLAAPVEGTTAADRVALFTPLLEAWHRAGTVVARDDVRQALACWTTMVENARPAVASTQAPPRLFEAAAEACPAGLPLQRQLDLAVQVVGAVSEAERGEALRLALNEIPRTRPDDVEAAVRLIGARVPLTRVVDGLADKDALPVLERLSRSGSPQPRYAESLDDLRATRAMPLGALSLDARADALCRLLDALAPRGEASEARRLYAGLSASVEEGRLREAEVPATIDALVQALGSGASVPKALRLAQAGDARPDLVAAAAARAAGPETAARIAALPPTGLPAFASAILAQAESAEEALAIGTATLDALSRTAGCQEGARLALDAVAEMADAPLQDRVDAIRDALPLVGAATADALVAVGDAVLAHVRFGSRVRHVVLRALQHDPEVGDAIRTGLEALGSFPKNLVSYDHAAAEIIAHRHARGAELADVGATVFRDVFRGMNSGDGVRVATAYMKALRSDPTSMWLAREMCGDLEGSEHLQAYIAEAAFEHPAAASGRELATMCLAVLDRVPEGSPRSAVRVAQPMLKALSRLYTDADSRAAIEEAERVAAAALGTSMAFGASTEGDVAARAAARRALLQLQSTEDATSRMHRRMAEADDAPKVEQADDYVVVAGVRVPRRR